ncbi:MAG: hypothetical protein Q9184_007180 [Pyrenodesmia sp. 2 TL-2023]
MSGLMNKVKDALSGDKNNTAEAEANKGPHDYHHGHSSTSGETGSYGANPTHGGLDQSSTSRDPMHSGRDDMTGRTTDTSGYGSHSTGSATTGPHSSSMANKADPRVDSDRDGSGYGRGTTGSGLTGSGTHGSSDYDRTTGSGLTGSNTSGPHSSSMANKADPRVDSDRAASLAAQPLALILPAWPIRLILASTLTATADVESKQGLAPPAQE